MQALMCIGIMGGYDTCKNSHAPMNRMFVLLFQSCHSFWSLNGHAIRREAPIFVNRFTFVSAQGVSFSVPVSSTDNYG